MVGKNLVSAVFGFGGGRGRDLGFLSGCSVGSLLRV